MKQNGSPNTSGFTHLFQFYGGNPPTGGWLMLSSAVCGLLAVHLILAALLFCWVDVLQPSSASKREEHSVFS